MRIGYDLRSIVAHGGESKPREKKVKGEQVTLLEVVRATEDILRAALRKAIKQIPEAGGRLAIPWDDLVLPEYERVPPEAAGPD